MSQDHLNDNQLQDFLDGNITETDPVAVHLETCPGCQKALAAYRGLYSALENDPGIALAPDFAEAVISRLPEKHPVEVPQQAVSRFHIRDSMVMFIAAAAVIAAAIYFISPDLLLKPFTSMPSAPSVSDSRIAQDVNGFLSRLNISYVMIVFTVMTFAGIGIVDRIIKYRREHQKPVSFLI